MEYHGKFGHNLGRIQQIYLMNRTDICYTICGIETQIVARTLSSFQCIKRCVQYLANQPHKTIFYPSNYYDGSNFTRLKWSWNQVEYQKTHNFLECHQYAYYNRIINRRRSVSGILHTLLGVSICWKV